MRRKGMLDVYFVRVHHTKSKIGVSVGQQERRVLAERVKSERMSAERKL